MLQNLTMNTSANARSQVREEEGGGLRQARRAAVKTQANILNGKSEKEFHSAVGQGVRRTPDAGQSTPPPTVPRSEQGVPQQPRLRLKKRVDKPRTVKNRWNVRSMAGRGRETAPMS